MKNSKESAAPASRYDLFPTTVLTFELDEPAMNAGLERHFLSDQRYRSADQAQKADSLNLMDFAGDVTALARLQRIFTERLNEYCRSVGWRGDFNLAMQIFPNIAPARHFVPSHNHVAHIAAVYYVKTPSFEGKPVIDWSSPISDYWRPEEGVLILHDPRFNASLMGGWQHYARVYPKAGLLIMFPAFLWHAVTPHFSDDPRLSVAANFKLERRGEAFEQRMRFVVD